MFCIKPDWPAPTNIRAYTTLRKGGISVAPFHELNLATHVGDEIKTVETNRHLMSTFLKLPTEPFWLNQIHSHRAIRIAKDAKNLEADASFTQEKNQICAILTADCLPILLCNQEGSEVAAIHAGWKGLLNGIIENTLNQLCSERKDILAWFGPAISPNFYTVGEDLYKKFITVNSQYELAFTLLNPTQWKMDLYHLASLRLKEQGIHAIYGGNFCTYSDSERFYSYRRDGHQTGRMATLIYIA